VALSARITSVTAVSWARDTSASIERFLRTDAVEGRERAAQHVIAGIDRVRALERPEVGDVGDRDDDGGIAPRVGANRAGILGVDIAADRQISIFSSAVCIAAAERRHDLLALSLMRKQRRAPRRARAEPRQAGEQGDQTLDLGSGGGGGHERRQLATGYCIAVDAGGARSAVIN